jgi:hypothetical protein
MRVERKILASDTDGNYYTILVLRDDHETFDQDRGRQMEPDALTTMKTDDGKSVTPISEGVYQIIYGPIVREVTSADPDAS